MRVSSQSTFEKTSFHMNLLQGKLGKQQTQISTGKSFQKLSEAPLKANQSMLINHSFDRIDQFQKNITDAKGFLDMTETTLGSAVDVLQQARETGLFAANDTYSDLDRKTFANEIDELINHVVDLANTKYLGKYIFSGEKTKTETFTYDGTNAIYQGDSSEIKFRTSSTSEMEVSVTGDQAFQKVLDSLINLRDQIETNNATNINNAVAQLDVALNETIDLRSEVGTRLNGIDTMNEIYENTKVDLKIKKEEVEGVNVTELISQFSETQRSYQAAIQTSVKIMQTSILKYI